MIRGAIKQVYLAALRFFASREAVVVVSLLARLAIRRDRRAARADARWRLLILDKAGFREDVEATFAGREDVAIDSMPREVPKALARGLLTGIVDDNDYHPLDPAFDAAKAGLRRFWTRAWPALTRSRPYDAVLTGNFGYYSERELAAALRTLDTPFVALHKENLKSPGRLDFFEIVYRERRGPFTGSRVLVYNEVEKDLQVRAGVAAPERISVTGMPRLDRVHARRRVLAGSAPRGVVVYFWFSSTIGLPLLPRKGKYPGEVVYETFDDRHALSLDRLSTETHAAIIALAERNPDLRVVVKTKGGARDQAQVTALFEERPRPPNLEVLHGGDVQELIFEASVVCGFNSTALLEALTAGRPVVQPRFAEATDPALTPYIVDLGDTVRYADDPQALVAALERLARESVAMPHDLSPTVSRELARWTGNADGQAGPRAARAILDEITRPARDEGAPYNQE